MLVVGAGPAGLSAAYHLRRLGHAVTILEAGPLAGGMMRFGIPKYRLPRDVLDAEVERIVDLGVEIALNTKVDDIEATMREGGFDAAFLAVGAHIAKRAYIPAGGAAQDPRRGEPPALDGGRRAAAARPQGRRLRRRQHRARRRAHRKRLGASEAIIVYRRTREKMPAHDFEVEEALQEGVSINWLSTIKSVEGGSMTVEKMKLDDKGFPQPTGEFETLEADSLVLALGQDVDLSLLDNAPGIVIENGVVKVGPDMMTGCARHVRRRRHGALRAHRHRRGRPRQEGGALHRRLSARPSLTRRRPSTSWRASTGSTPGTTRTRPETVRPTLEAVRRVENFEEVVKGLDETNALFEARRCLSCGNCFECDNCYGVCPDNAVIKLGPGKRFEFDYDYCKGCGLCAAECPCGAIDMVAEAI